MNKLLSVMTALAMIVGLTSTVFAAEQDWRTPFITALQDGKTATMATGEGLAYTAPEELVLKEAVSKAMEQDAPACECMKMAIDLEYNPYAVLKSIYSVGSNVTLDQLCMCATEAGIMKAIIAKAAVDALSPTGEALFNRDEIAQCQCLRGEDGLAYTPPPEEGLPYTAPLVPLQSVSADTGRSRTLATATN